MNRRRIRHIALLALAAVMTVGCGSASEEEVLPSPPQPGQETPIAFSGSLSEEGEVTRTDPTDPTGLETVLPEGNKKFKVWAYKNLSSGNQTVMNGYTVNWVENTAYTTTSNTHDWEYVGQGTDQTIKYWDWGADAYRFFGYTGSPTFSVVSDNAKVTIPVDLSAEHEDQLKAKIATIPYYSRLWCKTPSEDAFGKAVTLVFLQPFAKVRFMYKASDETAVFILNDQHFKPTDPLKSIYTMGTFTVTYPLIGTTEETWEVTGGSTSLPDGFVQEYYEDDDDPDTPVDPNAGKWYVVLPAKDQGSYTLSVKINNADRTAVVPAEYMNWQPGYQYTYVFKITDSGVLALDGVYSGFAPWNTEAATHNIYNW